MKDCEKDLILQKRVEHAVDAVLSPLEPSVFEQQKIIKRMTEGKPMKKTIPVGLIIAIALLLMTVSAISTARRTPIQNPACAATSIGMIPILSP